MSNNNIPVRIQQCLEQKHCHGHRPRGPRSGKWNGKNSCSDENVIFCCCCRRRNETTVECGLIGYLYIRNKKASVGSTVIAFIFFCLNRGSSIRIKYREIYNPFSGCFAFTPNVILHLGYPREAWAPDEEVEIGSTTQLSVSFGFGTFLRILLSSSGKWQTKRSRGEGKVKSDTGDTFWISLIKFYYWYPGMY